MIESIRAEDLEFLGNSFENGKKETHNEMA